MIALKLWTLLWAVRDPGSGEIRATREELAEAVGTSPAQVSRVMTRLARVGAVDRRRERVAGRRGRGEVIYTLNKGVAYPDQ